MSDCIRRPYSVYTTCTCQDCLAFSSRVKKMYAMGRLGDQVPTSLAAWQRIDDLLGIGWSPWAIASAAGIKPRFIESALSTRRTTGRWQKFGRVRARQVLAIDPRIIPPAGKVAAVGSRRRLQALAVMGHSAEHVADAADLPRMTVYAVRRGDTEQIGVELHKAIAGAYDQLWRVRGRGKAAATNATRNGWAPPLAWDDDTIDDPTAEPSGHVQQRPGKPGRPERKTAHVEDVEQLMLDGLTVAQIAARIGVQRDSVYRVLTRAGRRDLVERLIRREAA